MRIGITTSIATAIAIGVLIASSGGGGGGGTLANLWIDTNGGTCTRSASLIAYVDAAACSSLNDAYAAAANGDSVLVKTGTYGAQFIVRDEKYTTSDTADVTIQPETGATVTLADLQFGRHVPICGGSPDGPSNITVKNMADNASAVGDNCSQDGGGTQDCEVTVGTDSEYVTIQNYDACNFQVSGADHVYVLGGDWGPCTVTAAEDSGCSNMKLIDQPTDVVVDGALIHDIRIDYVSCNPTSLCHLECMFIASVTDGMLKNNTFKNCEYYDIFVQRFDGGPVSNLTIQNNFFDAQWSDQVQGGGPALAFSPNAQGAFSNVLVRFNSFHESAGIDVNNDGGSQVYTNFRVLGNIEHLTDCYASATYGYNVAIGSSPTTCGTGDTTSTGSAVYTNASQLGSGGDFHLKTGVNPAVDMVTPLTSDYLLTTDIDGGTRPNGSARDAGADERGAP